MTSAQKRTPGILPICPPRRKPLPHEIQHPAPAIVRRSSRIRDNARPRAESRALEQRRLGLIADEKIEPPLRPTDSISNSPETTTASNVLELASRAVISSVEDFLAPKAGPGGEFPAVGTRSPVQQGRARAETMGAAARDYYRLQGEDPDQYDYQRGQQDFEYISRTCGDPRPVDLPVTVRKWLFDLEETETLKEQEMAVRGMKRFWLLR
jgi:hypothetical protein